MCCPNCSGTLKSYALQKRGAAIPLHEIFEVYKCKNGTCGASSGYFAIVQVHIADGNSLEEEDEEQEVIE